MALCCASETLYFLSQYEIKHPQSQKFFKKSNSNNYRDSSFSSKSNPISKAGSNIYFHKQSYNTQLQLPLATHCIRTRQGQHYRRDVACLEQESNFAPHRVWLNSDGDSLVAVLDNIAYTKVILNTNINKNNNNNKLNLLTQKYIKATYL